MRIVSSRVVRDRTPFIGRDRERELLRKDLERGFGLLTITGPSGIGKTRLATQIARELAASFEDEGGAWICGLSACRDPSDVEAALARTLGLSHLDGKALASTIASRGRLLLILDNLDSVAARIGDLLRSWLEGCPSLQMVTTSILPVELDDAIRHELGPMEAEDAVALYLERAHRAWAGKITDGDHGDVEELVGRLDRIPLAIELAAARIRLFPPKALLSRFDDRFEILRSGDRGRHGSLLEALTLTWELLSPEEQGILTRASVFEGGFGYDAAVGILEDDSSRGEALLLLDGLRSKALLQLEDSEHPRILLFESVRDFASLELRRSGQEAELLRRHASYFVELGERHVRRLEGPEAMASIAWLRAERENLVAILHRHRERDPSIAARAGIVLYSLIKLDGYLPSGFQLLHLALQAARASGDRILLARAICCYYTAAARHGRADEARAGLEEGLALAREAGSREEEGNLLVALGWLHLRTGELDSSAHLLDRAVGLAREEELPLLEVSALMVRGEGAHARSDVEEAERFAADAMAVLRRNDFPLREGTCLHWLALVWATQGRFNESRTAIREALERCRAMGDRGFEATALTNLGGVELSAGRLDEAERASQEALSIHRELGNRRSEALVVGNLGNVALERGELELAEERLAEASDHFGEAGDRKLRSAYLPFLAACQARLGRFDEARQNLETARLYFGEVGDGSSDAMVRILEGVLELAEARRLSPAEAEAAQTLAASAAARLRNLDRKPTGGMFEAIRLLEKDLAHWEIERAEKEAEGVLVGPEATWFQLPGKGKVELRRRLALRRIFEALVRSRLADPGKGIEPHSLFESGWPGEKLHPDHATRRIYLAIWTLRSLGLAELLLSQTDGYLLDPAVPMAVQRE